MEAYGAFAGVYDLLMKNAGHKRWYRYLKRIWKRYGASPELVLDLGCGTGSISVLLAEGGRDVIGVDGSPEMLAVAKAKAREKNLDILFLNQRLQSFELYGTVDCIISFFDCINYIVKKDELLRVFKLAANYLNYGGLFIFDVNTPYKFRKKLASNTFAQSAESCSYIWENRYDKIRGINEYALSLFIKNGAGLYENHVEYHYQRAYSKRRLSLLLKKAGLTVLGVYGAFSFKRPQRNAERIFFVCRREMPEGVK